MKGNLKREKNRKFHLMEYDKNDSIYKTSSEIEIRGEVNRGRRSVSAEKASTK